MRLLSKTIVFLISLQINCDDLFQEEKIELKEGFKIVKQGSYRELMFSYIDKENKEITVLFLSEAAVSFQESDSLILLKTTTHGINSRMNYWIINKRNIPKCEELGYGDCQESLEENLNGPYTYEQFMDKCDSMSVIPQLVSTR